MGFVLEFLNISYTLYFLFQCLYKSFYDEAK